MKRLMLALMLVGLVLGMGHVPARAADEGPAYVSNEILIQFKDGTTAAQQEVARGKVKASKAEKIRSQGNGASKLELANLPADIDAKAAIALLKGDAAVEFAEPNYIYTTGATSNDPRFLDGSLWGMYGAGTSPANQYGSNAATAWAAGKTGSNSVYIAVIDEGMDITHPDLAANIWTNSFDPADGIDNDGNGYIDDVNGWDFADNNSTVFDGSGDDHGTHVSGTIGGAGGNGIGVAGVNWSVTMIAAKFLGASGGTTANAIRAVDYVTDLKTRHGLNIVATSNSWGGGGFSQGLADAIIRGAKAEILFVAAAGNGNFLGMPQNNDRTANYPSNYNTTQGTSTESAASYDAVIAVAAIDRAGALASFSNYGRSTVDLGAPGVAVLSTTPGSSYASYSGTSMATPHVSGAVALYKSVKPGATAAQTRSALLDSAVATLSLRRKTVTGGRLDVNAALSR